MVEKRLVHDTKTDIIAGILYTMAAVIGSFPIIKTDIMGIVPTYYRVLIPLLFLYFLVRRLQTRNDIKYYNRRYVVFIGFLVIMMAWGTILLFTAEYVDRNDGMRELLELVLGFLSILIIYEICLRQSGFRIIIYSLRVVIVALTVLAIVEMSTAIHLYTSKFSDPEYIARYIEHVGDLHHDGKISYNATGIFYNENDFSAFLGLFVPVFFPQVMYKRFTNILFGLELALILVILSQNDAWICMISPVIGTVAYLLLIRAKIRIWLASIAAFLVVKMFGVNAFAGIVYAVYKVLPGVDVPYGIATMFHEGSSGLPEVIEGQIIGVENESGSTFTRMSTYLEGVKRTFTESYGMGFGPGSYGKYVDAHQPAGMLKNPHSMWLEIIMQYGVVITILFIVLILGLFFRLCIHYHETHRREYAVIIAMDIIFVLICFAPSNYFGVSYMWIPIGLSLVFANIRLESIKKPREMKKWF